MSQQSITVAKRVNAVLVYLNRDIVSKLLKMIGLLHDALAMPYLEYCVQFNHHNTKMPLKNWNDGREEKTRIVKCLVIKSCEEQLK